MHCLNTHVLDAPKKQNNVYARFQFTSKQTMYMFCSCFELFILVGLQQTTGYHLLCLFSLVMLLCTVVVCSGSVIFVWSYKVIFSEK